MFKKTAFIISWVIIPTVLWGGSRTIRVGGSAEIEPIVAEAAHRFKALKRKARFRISSSNTADGIIALAKKKINLAMAFRKLRIDEEDLFNLAQPHLTSIGRDAILPVVSYEVFKLGVTSLSLEEVGKIFSGEIKNWKAVGGPDQEIEIVDHKQGSDLYSIFMRAVFKGMKPTLSNNRTVATSMGKAQSLVENSKSAISYLPVAQTKPRVRALGIRQGSRVVYPNRLNLINKFFPTVRDIDMVTIGTPTGKLKDFVDFLLSEEGQKIVKKNKFIPIH